MLVMKKMWVNFPIMNFSHYFCNEAAELMLDLDCGGGGGGPHAQGFLRRLTVTFSQHVAAWVKLWIWNYISEMKLCYDNTC